MHFRTQTLANICKVGMAGRRVCVCLQRVSSHARNKDRRQDFLKYIYVYIFRIYLKYSPYAYIYIRLCHRMDLNE